MDNNYQPSEERFLTLLPRQITGSISSEEKAELEQILFSYPDLKLQAEFFTGMWEQEKNIVPSPEVEEAYMRHLLKYRSDFLREENHEKMKNENEMEIPVHFQKPLIPKKWRYVIAASLMIFIFVITVFYYQKPLQAENPPSISSVITRYGNKSKISLPDGSQVWINAGSRLDYNNADFNKSIREVYLSGEAYFDIAHNPGKPFIVRSGNMRIKVLGTMFNVKAYPEEHKMETSLIRGSIEITIKDRPENKYILRPNEKLVVTNEGMGDQSLALNTANMNKGSGEIADIIALKKVDYSSLDKLVIETAWVQNKLVFRSEKFSDIAKKMERWYDIEIRFRNTNKEELKFTGVFTTESIIQALQAMQVVHPFNYVKENNIIFID